MLTPFLGYWLASIVAGFTIAQNLEGGLHGILWDGPYLQATVWVGSCAIIFLLVMAATACLSLRAAWQTDAKWLVAIVAAFWITPFILSILWPNILPELMSPQNPIVLQGSPGPIPVGSKSGTVIIVVVTMILGWSIFLPLITTRHKALRPLIDCIWYPAGVLSAAIFLVNNTNTNVTNHAIADDLDLVKQTSTVLVLGTGRMQDICASTAGKDFQNLCNWSKGFRKELQDLMSSPKSVQFDLNSELGEDKDLLLQQADLLNSQFCSGANASKQCEFIPPILFNIENQDEFINYMRTDWIFPLLQVGKKLEARTQHMSILLDEARLQGVYSNIQWIFLVFFSFLCGGKVANATMTLLQTKTVTSSSPMPVRDNRQDSGFHQGDRAVPDRCGACSRSVTPRWARRGATRRPRCRLRCPRFYAAPQFHQTNTKT